MLRTAQHDRTERDFSTSVEMTGLMDSSARCETTAPG